MKQTEMNPTMQEKITGKVIPETAARTALGTVLKILPETAQRMATVTVTEIKHLTNTIQKKTESLTDIDSVRKTKDKSRKKNVQEWQI